MEIKTRVFISYYGNENGRHCVGEKIISTNEQYPFSKRVIVEIKEKLCELAGLQNAIILNIIPLSLEEE